MSRVSPSQALEFVRTAELPALTEDEAALEGAGEFDFEKGKAQALIVGSDIVSFVRGVSEERRRDIVNSALLAQLVANKRVPDATRVFDWYDAYFEALSNIGWVIQTRQFVQHVEQSDRFEAHEAILAVAATLLGSAATSLQVVKATLDALKSLKQNSPWITLFHRESQRASTARFQVTLAEEAPAGQFLVTLMAFGLNAKGTLTQVLFFKFQSNDVELKHASGSVTINEQVIMAVRDDIAGKLVGYSQNYIRTLPDLG